MRYIVYLFKCCCGPRGCTISGIGPIRESSTTRIMYSIMLLIVSVILIMSHEKLIVKLLQSEFNETFNSTCVHLLAESSCQRLSGYKAIYRIAYSFFIFHLTMMLLCLRISTSKGWRARMHNGFWFIKCLGTTLIWIVLYLIPLFEDIIFVTTVIGMIAAFIFIVIQHVSLIDCAYEFNGYLRSKGSENYGFIVLIYVVATVLYLLTGCFYAIIYLQFALPNYCHINRAVIIINVAASVVLVLLSFCVKKYTHCKLYIPGGVICLFVAFLTWTALSSTPEIIVSNREPVNFSKLNKTHVYEVTESAFSCKRESKFFKRYIGEDLHAYLGIVVMLFMAVYSSIKSTVDYKRYGIKPSKSKLSSFSQFGNFQEHKEVQELNSLQNCDISTTNISTHVTEVNEGDSGYEITPYGVMERNVSEVPMDCNESAKTENMPNGPDHVFPRSNIIETQIESNLDLEKQSSKVAITEAAKESHEDFTKRDRYLIYDEYFAVRYSYSWFHFVFALAYLFVMVQLTNWYSPETSNLRKFSGTWPSMWMKIITSWMALLLFGWTLLSPAFCIGRKLYEGPIDSMKRYRKTII